jgi:hypothetical protein
MCSDVKCCDAHMPVLALTARGVIRKTSFWDRLVFAKIHAKLGGRVKLVITGAAPISSEVLLDLRAMLGCSVFEGYGQTEGTAGSCMTLPGDSRAGNVGPPLPCNEIKVCSASLSLSLPPNTCARVNRLVLRCVCVVLCGVVWCGVDSCAMCRTWVWWRRATIAAKSAIAAPTSSSVICTTKRAPPKRSTLRGGCTPAILARGSRTACSNSSTAKNLSSNLVLHLAAPLHLALVPEV